MKIKNQQTLKYKGKQLENVIKSKFLMYSFLFSSIFFFNCKTNLGKSDRNFILWQNTEQLSFKDFKGTPTRSNNDLFGHCSTQYRFEHHLDKITGIPKYTIKCYFNKKLSFISYKNDSLTLRHEQIHFNLTELFCRRTRKSWDSLNKMKEKKLSYYNIVRNKNLKEINSLDALFDYEEHNILNAQINYEPTKHVDSIIKKWELRIERELRLLKHYE